jgi:hypothetical protein
VQEWLQEDEQLDRLLDIAGWNLGRFNQPGEAEEAWADFFADRLPSVILRYDREAEGTVGFWPFVCFCFRRFCRDRAARREREDRSVRLLRVPGPRPDPVKAAEWREVGEILMAGIKALPERRRAAFLLHHVEGFSLVETAEQMGVTYQAAAMLVFHARGTLRRWLDDNYPGLLEEVMDDV